jgi:hypothetical protein
MMVCEQTSNYNLNLNALGLHLYSANLFAHNMDLGVVKSHRPVSLSPFKCQRHVSVVQAYTGAIHDVIRSELSAWCGQGEVTGVRACRRLTFLVTAHVLLGMRIDEQHVSEMSELFETFMTSFFSFPLALPGTAFSKVRLLLCLKTFS